MLEFCDADMETTYPDFVEHEYRVNHELGRNREGGRISYLAHRLDDETELVVIKQFRFLQGDSNWQGFKAYEREIAVLRDLDHPRIPHYLDSFQTNDGFCMVQEYKAAPTLGERRSFTAIEIKQISLSVLEILVYLQQRLPPIFHRDIKPENILVDDDKQAYLIDFGLAKLEHQDLAVSSIVAGTPGFMAPEELFNRPLDRSSDLYSLGATIICLLTDTRSTDISNLLDENYRFKFQHLVTGVNPEFIVWLQRLVAPLGHQSSMVAGPERRFPDAKTAMQKLQIIDIEHTSSEESITAPNIVPTSDRLRKFAPLVGVALVLAICSVWFDLTRSRSIVTTSTTAIPVATANTSDSWFNTIKPRCNTVEVMTAIQASPPTPGWEGTGYAAACYALAGKIDAADLAIGRLDPSARAAAVNIVFEIGHPVADAGDDRSAGPIMELVLKYWPQNYMAMYHAGMSAYALGDTPRSKSRLTDFLNTYTASDGWTNNARTVMEKIDRGISNGSYPKDP
jgi:serine/threonine protein kinase